MAKTIIIGVYSIGLAKENLDEAESILKGFDGLYEAEKFLGIIEKIRG